MSGQTNKVKLYHSEGWDGSAKLVSNNPTVSLITQTIDAMEWTEFNSVRIEFDENNWMEASGNITEDGLALICMLNGNEKISNEAPYNLTVVKEALVKFLMNDTSYNTLFDSNTTVHDWRPLAEIKHKAEKRRHLLNLTAATILIIGFISYFYFSLNDRFKFIGHETKFTYGVVTAVKLEPVRSGYYQVVNYEFEFKSKSYKGSFRGTKRTGKHKIGDRIKIRHSINDPTISEWVGTLREKDQ